MRRTCERPGCGAPSAVLYGYGSGSMWLDAWSPDRDPAEAPVDARGVVCARHGALLSPPRGWTMDDRRESIPRLFKPRDRGGLAVVPDEVPETAKKIKRDPTAPTRRPKASDLPRPRLFADLEDSATEPPAPEPAPDVMAEPDVVRPEPVQPEPLESEIIQSVVVQPEPVQSEIVEAAPPAELDSAGEPEDVGESRDDDSTELLIRQDATGTTSRPAATFDPDEDFARDATGPMLRDALRPRLSGRWDPTAELLRPTDHGSERA